MKNEIMLIGLIAGGGYVFEKQILQNAQKVRKKSSANSGSTYISLGKVGSVMPSMESSGFLSSISQGFNNLSSRISQNQNNYISGFKSQDLRIRNLSNNLSNEISKLKNNSFGKLNQTVSNFGNKYNPSNIVKKASIGFWDKASNLIGSQITRIVEFPFISLWKGGVGIGNDLLSSGIPQGASRMGSTIIRASSVASILSPISPITLVSKSIGSSSSSNYNHRQHSYGGGGGSFNNDKGRTYSGAYGGVTSQGGGEYSFPGGGGYSSPVGPILTAPPSNPVSKVPKSYNPKPPKSSGGGLFGGIGGWLGGLF